MTTLADMPLTLTVEQAGDLLGVSRSCAYGAARAGQIPTIRVGRRLLVPRHKLEALLGVPTNDFATEGNGGEIEDEADDGGTVSLS